MIVCVCVWGGGDIYYSVSCLNELRIIVCSHAVVMNGDQFLVFLMLGMSYARRLFNVGVCCVAHNWHLSD